MNVLQDVPGWGDDVNIHGYLQDVMTYIMQQRAADYSELKGGRAFAKEYVSGCLTHSVTACLYFLPPHRTKPVRYYVSSTAKISIFGSISCVGMQQVIYRSGCKHCNICTQQGLIGGCLVVEWWGGFC